GNIVFSSTCATYGIPETMPITEQTPQAPINPYGESKLMFERALRWFKACHGIRHVALRYFNAAGADYGTGARHDPETRIIPLALLAVLGRIPFFQVFGDDYDTPDGTCIRDYVHVTDLAEAHKLALEHLRGGGESLQLNLGTGHGTSVLKVIAAVERITGKDVPYVISPRRAGDPAVLVANSARAEIALGWRTRRDLDDIIRSAWEWRRP
ncbi:MAG TPA: UDP-glucose 4-epimerase, partial [Rhodospirillales bacterium]|nr:UDP-glucose 4-epimerase [Rhodospirillales bacterium]